MSGSEENTPRRHSTDDEGPEEEPVERQHRRRESALHVFQQAGTTLGQFMVKTPDLIDDSRVRTSLSSVAEEGGGQRSSTSSTSSSLASPRPVSPRPLALETARPSSPKVFIHAIPASTSPTVQISPSAAAGVPTATALNSPRSQSYSGVGSQSAKDMGGHGATSPTNKQQQQAAAAQRRASRDDGAQKTKCAVTNCMSFAVRGKFCLCHVFRQTLGGVQTSHPEQHDIAYKIVDTEKEYLNSLTLITHYFVGRLKFAIELGKPIIAQEDIELIFTNVEEVRKLSHQLSTDLQEIYMQRVLINQVPLTLLHFSPQFRCYQTYLENYDDALIRLRVLRAENPDFAFFLELNEKAEGVKLEELLTTPIKRIPKYLTYLEEMLKKSSLPEQGALVEDIKHCGRKIKRIADSINASLSKKESLEKVKELSSKFEKDANYQDLVAPNRLLIHQGLIRFRKTGGILSSDKEYQIFLFTDVLVYASRSGKKYKMKQVIPLKGMKVDPVPGPKQKNTDILVTMEKAEVNGSNHLTLDCGDMGQRQEWITLLDKCIRAYEKAEKTLEVHAFDDKKKVVKSAKLQAMLGGT